MKREESRFSIDQINKVIRNWEQIAKKYNGKFEIRKRVYSDRDVLEQLTNYQRKDVLYNCLFFFDIYIPHKQNQIKIATSEIKTPIFSYEYKGLKQFNFSIRNEDFMDKISKYFGQNDVEIDNKKFDSNFYIETNEPEVTKKFLDSKITNWLEETSIAYFDFNSTKSKNTLTLFCSINEMDITKIEETVNMFKYCSFKLESIK